MTDRQLTVLDNYGYVNARVRAMKSVLLKRDFYEELLKSDSFTNLISLLEKTPYKPEMEECGISRSLASGIDEALKRNLTRTFRKFLGFSGGEPHDLVLLLLGRWDLHNIITILRGIHIGASQEQILESVVPAGELDMPLLNQLSQEKTVKGFIDILATWGSSYARALTEKYPKYIENEDLSIMELALDKMYYNYVLRRVEDGGANCKILKDLIVGEIDAINVTTILRLQKMSLQDFVAKKRKEKKEIVLKEETVVEKEKPAEFKQIYKQKLSLYLEKVKVFFKEEKYLKGKEQIAVWAGALKEKIRKSWLRLIIDEGRGGAVFGAKDKSFILRRLLKNSGQLIEEDIEEFLRRAARGSVLAKRKIKGFNFKEVFGSVRTSVNKIGKIGKKDKVVEVPKKEEKLSDARLREIEREMTERQVREFFIPGGKEISEGRFVKLCLTLDVEKVVQDLVNTSFGWILKGVLERYLEYNTLSVLERKMEELIIKKGINCYNKGQLSIGIPLGYVWKKYNEVVNLRIIVRCKKIGMPDRKIREELILL